jgi:hypothetical protein
MCHDVGVDGEALRVWRRASENVERAAEVIPTCSGSIYDFVVGERSEVLNSRLSSAASRLACCDRVSHQRKAFGAGVWASLRELGSRTERVVWWTEIRVRRQSRYLKGQG